MLKECKEQIILSESRDKFLEMVKKKLDDVEVSVLRQAPRPGSEPFDA
jgi:hypothetical protein